MQHGDGDEGANALVDDNKKRTLAKMMAAVAVAVVDDDAMPTNEPPRIVFSSLLPSPLLLPLLLPIRSRADGSILLVEVLTPT